MARAAWKSPHTMEITRIARPQSRPTEWPSPYRMASEGTKNRIESDAAMDLMEATLRSEQDQARKELSALAALPSMKASGEVAAAAAALDRYAGLEARILALSRENTNVRSLALTLNQERKTMAVALEAQAALKQAILAEPIPGVTYGLAPNPRR